ncbi:MAG: hypothetical protein JSV33_05010 [bacterium]|nr:MAG: hypothetical protein JSV33_05010 [bacterium]
MMSIPSVQFFGIWGSSNSNIFAVGNNNMSASDGRIYHYNGAVWSMELDTNTSLKAVWGGGANDVFAAGFYGIVLHYNGDVWTQIRSNQCVPDPGWLCREIIYGIWGVSGDDFYIAGTTRRQVDDPHVEVYNYDPLVQRCIGHQYWLEEMSMPESPGYDSLICDAIWGTSGTDIFVAARDISSGSVMYHYDGTGWTIIGNGMGADIWGASSTEVYAIGGTGVLY